MDAGPNPISCKERKHSKIMGRWCRESLVMGPGKKKPMQFIIRFNACVLSNTSSTPPEKIKSVNSGTTLSGEAWPLLDFLTDLCEGSLWLGQMDIATLKHAQ